MMQGCYDNVNKDYCKYGKVGIKVDKRWHDFDNFVDDVSPIQENKFLGRLRVGDNFGPDNFKWMDRVELAQQTKTYSEWLKSTRMANRMCA